MCTCYTILTVAAGVSNLKYAEGITNANVYTNRMMLATTLELILFLFPMTKLNSNEQRSFSSYMLYFSLL
jgi:uncharacterized membrane protein